MRNYSTNDSPVPTDKLLKAARLIDEITHLFEDIDNLTSDAEQEARRQEYATLGPGIYYSLDLQLVKHSTNHPQGLPTTEPVSVMQLCTDTYLAPKLFNVLRLKGWESVGLVSAAIELLDTAILTKATAPTLTD